MNSKDYRKKARPFHLAHLFQLRHIGCHGVVNIIEREGRVAVCFGTVLDVDIVSAESEKVMGGFHVSITCEKRKD